MAEDKDSSQEKTEEATPHKKKQAREKGQVPRSKELTTMLMLMSASAFLIMIGPWSGIYFEEVMTKGLLLSRDQAFDTSLVIPHLLELFGEALYAVIPFFVIFIIISILGSIMVGGFSFSMQAVEPKFSKLNPITGIKRMFGVKGLVELIKSIIKVFLVGLISYLVIKSYVVEINTVSSSLDLRVSVSNALEFLGWFFLILSSSMILVSLIDVPYQIYNYLNELKMTLQQVKEEYKQMEGNPEMKSKRRQVQMEMASKRMMADVPEADVVITNPTHYAVALKYEQNNDEAPVLVAKGVEEIAAKIRMIAKENEVRIIESPHLARSLYYHVEVGEQIPQGLYNAVAKILTFVFSKDPKMLEENEIGVEEFIPEELKK